MAFRQAVIQLGSWTVKAGLWEQTFLPTHEIPACVRPVRDNEGNITARRYGEHDSKNGVYPIIEGRLVDLAELQHLLYKHVHPLQPPSPLPRRHIFVDLLFSGTPSSSLSDVPVLMVIPAAWSRNTRYLLCKMLLEDLGVSGVYLGDAPVMAAFGCATPNALVIDVGHSVTEVAGMFDGEILPGAYDMVPFGGSHIDKHFASLLSGDPCFLESISGREDHIIPLIQDVAHAFKESELCHPQKSIIVGDSPTLPPVELEFKLTDDTALTLQVGSSRAKLMDVLTTGDAASPTLPSLIDIICSILQRCDPDKRPILLDHIVITGGSSRHPSLRSALKIALKSRLPASEFSGEHQPRTLRVRSVPEYYPEIWQKATPLAAWFGAGITAKCVLNDFRNLYTREDLIQHGRKVFFLSNK